MIGLTVNFDHGIELTWLLIDSFINWSHEEPLFDVSVDCVSEIIQSPTERQELNSGSWSLIHILRSTSWFYTQHCKILNTDQTMRFVDINSKLS